MDSDGPLKLLFCKYAQDLLLLTGDLGATVSRAGPVEIQALKRHVDCVLELKKQGELYYRHLEFQAEPDPEMAKRCFRYNTQLVLQYDAPVLTTVLYLHPPKPKRPAVFRVMLGGREINRWSFGEICLWERNASEGLTGAPGLVALVPLMKGGSDRAIVKQAARRIERAFPRERLSDAEDVLLALASRYYTVRELSRIVGRDRMLQSSLYVEGRAEGRLDAQRELCVALTRKYHPAIGTAALTRIGACSNRARLEQWALAAPDLNDAEFLRLLGVPSPSQAMPRGRRPRRRG